MIFHYQSGSQTYEIKIDRQGSGFQAEIDGEFYLVEILSEEAGLISLRLAGHPFRISWAEKQGKKWIYSHGCTYLLERPTTQRSLKSPGSTENSQLRAPMPAQVRSVEVAVGDEVQKGQTLILLEAMKMEIRVTAPIDGKIQKLTIQAGQTVNRDDVLVVIE